MNTGFSSVILRLILTTLAVAITVLLAFAAGITETLIDYNPLLLVVLVAGISIAIRGGSSLYTPLVLLIIMNLFWLGEFGSKVCADCYEDYGPVAYAIYSLVMVLCIVPSILMEFLLTKRLKFFYRGHPFLVYVRYLAFTVGVGTIIFGAVALSLYVSDSYVLAGVLQVILYLAAVTVAAWASQPGPGVSAQHRLSDADG